MRTVRVSGCGVCGGRERTEQAQYDRRGGGVKGGGGVKKGGESTASGLAGVNSVNGYPAGSIQPEMVGKNEEQSLSSWNNCSIVIYLQAMPTHVSI